MLGPLIEAIEGIHVKLTIITQTHFSPSLSLQYMYGSFLNTVQITDKSSPSEPNAPRTTSKDTSSFWEGDVFPWRHSGAYIS